MVNKVLKDLTEKRNEISKISFMNQNIFIDGLGFRTYYNINAYMISERRHIKVSRFIKDVLETAFYYPVINRLNLKI